MIAVLDQTQAETMSAGTQSLHEGLQSSAVPYYCRYFGDSLARLYWHEDNLRLGVLPAHDTFFSSLVKGGALDDLFAEGLLPQVDETGVDHAGFEHCYRLNAQSRITLWHEWSPKMLKDAAIHILGLLQRLNEKLLTLRNPHPWNVLFSGTRFVYANPGGIVPFTNESFTYSYEKIAQYFLRPLLLIEQGRQHLAMRLIADMRSGVLREDLTDPSLPEWGTADSASEFLHRVMERIQRTALPSAGERWLRYFETDCDFSEGTSWQRKQAALESLLRDASIESVLDLGANTGHYARVAARLGREVIATDFDPALVDEVYRQTQTTGPALYPAVLDFAHPAPGQGVTNGWLQPASQRLQSDLVLCFALTHHMVFGKYRMDFEQIAQGIRSYSKRWALVEFVGRERINPASWRPDADEWYTSQHLRAALLRYFPSVQILAPARDGRRLLVCGDGECAL